METCSPSGPLVVEITSYSVEKKTNKKEMDWGLIKVES